MVLPRMLPSTPPNIGLRFRSRVAIDWSRLRSLTARELISALERDGFVFRWQTGSHRRYQHPDGRRVTVSFHSPGQTFRADILRRIIRDQARWNVADLTRLRLL